MAFERYSVGFRNERNRCGEKVIASITGHAARPILVIGALLVKAGFDVTRKYDLLFDRETLTLAIEPTDGKFGLNVQEKPNQHGDQSSYMMSAVGFCKRFGLTDRYEAYSGTWDGEKWILPLAKR